MTSNLRWRPLPTFPDLPALLVSPGFNVQSSSYSLEITDLANIWTESLDRKGILKRSLNEDTSIDLSDGDKEQWRVFLSKLEAAFDPTSPDHGLTSLTLSPHGTGDLLLQIACVLPKPLEPLKWPVYLTKRQPDVLASDLVVPLIRSNQVRAQEAEYLVSRLKEKDAVINRLVDKLLAVGTGLEHVFHSLPIKRKATRAMAEEKVQGLAPFNEDQWRTHCASTLEMPQDVSSLLLNAFGNSSIDGERGGIEVSSQVNDWWGSFETKSAINKPQEQTISAEERPSTPDKGKSAADSDDDFQVQATQATQVTPVSAKKNRGRRQVAIQDGDTTDEGDSLALIPDSHPNVEERPYPRLGVLGGKRGLSQVQSQSQSSHTVPNDDDTASESDPEPVKPSPARNTRSKPVGAIGGSKKASSPPLAKSPSPARPPPKEDDETASESETGSAPRASPAAAPVQKRRGGGLGPIGGRSRTTPAPPEEQSRATSVESSTGPRPRQKLGAIGKSTGGDSRRRPQAESSVEPPAAAEEETMEQKAERKRAELAKELERKAAAPAKKKRRF
ncbi:hypothetical protein SLS62_006837 [Diatrype stigma]|uniref:Non-homologous end-joining factor 1 n=1 Tax=Diatrype stigma TaxID=117547 RepID=A0AAN9UXP9_9PEZI